MVRAHERRQQARFAIQRGLSRRRACALFQVARSTVHYHSRLLARDAAVRQQLHGIAQRDLRYGERRAWALVRADGATITSKRVHRGWCQAGVHVPQRKRRRRVREHGQRPLAPTHANQVWAYDFLTDRCANGQQVKLLPVVDEWTGAWVAIQVAGRITAKPVIAVRGELLQQGPPMDIRSDTGPECSARAVKAWLAQEGIQTAYIDAGKPWQHGTNESVGGTLRDACLNLEWFRHRTEARMVIEQWRQHDHEQRPHSSLGYRTPAQMRADQYIGKRLSQYVVRRTGSGHRFPSFAGFPIPTNIS